MGKRNSLSKHEVALIKRLLIDYNFQNQEISGMINRSRGDASKDVSPGRISNIKNNQIQKYAQIEPATKAEVDNFLAENRRKLREIGKPVSPVDDNLLLELLPLKKDSKTHLDISETNKIECKEGFNLPLKTVAAFANNKGGYLVLGVAAKSGEIKGIPSAKIKQFDYNKWNQSVRSNLGIEIEFHHKFLNFGEKKIAVFHVAEAHTKPVIFIKAADGISEGHIYYRYAGEDRLIAPSDLQRLIEERVRKNSEAILSKHISNILRAGVENAAVLDLRTGEVEGKSGGFYIDETILPKISFIKEGQFSEKSGAPTLKLVGDVETTSLKVSYQKEDILKQYPYSWTDVYTAIRKENSEATPNRINKIIKENGIKSNPTYSHYIFTKAKQQKEYEKKNKLPKSITSSYNSKAIEFIQEKLKLEQ
ncbi:AlbA family DNA-binding domain-containing protein [Thalassospira tepidiphila]|uniref:AlbA family DNA-binding domain-containing protein n=1 Tax=Thalassospira tepidiphila TaxID=393657 RepID=UPI0030C6E42D